jgi:biotin-dependent carboxylase-like uncharacterized protein
VLEVVTAAGLCLVQDGGRAGHMHEGVPPGGPLVPEQLARANAAVENAPGEAGIEVVGTIALRAHAPMVVASDDGAPVRLAAGDAWTSAAAAKHGVVQYVAVRGGVGVPVVLGGRGTLLVAALGGHEGRPLRRGDMLAVGGAPRADVPLPALPALPDLHAPVFVVLGPDRDRFDGRAIDALLGGTFAVTSRRDRIGMVLDGTPLARLDADGGVSAPMVRGAIQVPASGQPIVLGPDHPTTGGYPVIATVVRGSLGALAARPTGAPVRFALRR